MSLKIARTDHEWPPVIAIDGVLTAGTAGACLDQIADRFEDSFVVDLSGVYACDPAGATALVDLQTKVSRRGGRCVFAALSYPVARALRTTGLGRLVSISSTASIARRRLATARPTGTAGSDVT